MECLASYVPEHYTHSMHYFGLLAPRSIQTMRSVVFAAIGQPVPPPAERLPWAAARKKYFGVDPLLDYKGKRMHKVGRIKPSGDPADRSSAPNRSGRDRSAIAQRRTIESSAS
jgi:hypothetical protein